MRLGWWGGEGQGESPGDCGGVRTSQVLSGEGKPGVRGEGKPAAEDGGGGGAGFVPAEGHGRLTQGQQTKQ